MLSLRARIFIIISLIVLVVLGITIFLLVRSKNAPTSTDNTTATDGATQNGLNLLPATPVPVANISNNLKVTPLTSLEIQQKGVQQIAKIFLERYNSYSAESRYQNVLDVQALVTKSLWGQIGAKLSPGAVNNTIPAFSSVVTKAYSTKLDSWSEQSALVELQVKITEEKNGAISNRDAGAKVSMLNDGGNWLVDKFEWIK
jgi:hypothetical protein